MPKFKRAQTHYLSSFCLVKGVISSLLTQLQMMLQTLLRTSCNSHKIPNDRTIFFFMARIPCGKLPRQNLKESLHSISGACGKFWVLIKLHEKWRWSERATFRLSFCLTVLWCLVSSGIDDLIRKSPFSTLSRKGSRNLLAFSNPFYPSNSLPFFDISF